MRIDDLTPGPTFKADVEFPVTGAGKTNLSFTFRTRNKTALVLLLEKMKDYDDTKSLQEVLAGWELEDECNAENIQRFADTFPQAPLAIMTRYFKECGIPLR